MTWEDPSDDPAEEPYDGGGFQGPEPWAGGGFQGPEPWDEAEPQRWPLDWRGLYPRERWIWFERLWNDVCMLRTRYRLPVRARWWEDAVQVEALAALAAWTARYDSGEWDDPPGKLALLFEIERVHALLRDGHDPFDPDRDRLAFARHLVEIGCRPPPPAAAGLDGRGMS